MDKSSVLIVEDEMIIASDLARKLAGLGYEVAATVSTGEEAVKLACSLAPDLILMDIKLKGKMDGIAAADEIRLRIDIPVIYLTAHSDSGTLDRALISEPFGYILKPFDERNLAATIALALYKHQMDRQMREKNELLNFQSIQLQQANEELAVANEELRAQKEELCWQSGQLQLANEELATANEELQLQGEELATANQELELAKALLQDSNTMLEARVAERTRDLVKAVDTLQEEVGARSRAENDLRISEETVRRLNRLYAVVSATNQAIVHATDSASIFREFCRVAVELGGFRLAWVGLVERETGLVNIVAASGVTAYLDGIRISVGLEPEGLGPTGRAIREGTYCICNDFHASDITRPWHEKAKAHGLAASASIAVRQGGEVVGALTLYAGEKGFFDREHEELLLQMGGDVSFALDNFRQAALRREAEEALRLETAERLRTAEELQEKERMLMLQNRQAAMGEMIANIAHQWRQPLNAVGMVMQSLTILNETGKLTAEKLESMEKQVMGLIQHMSQTIDDFRNFFIPDRERAEFQVRHAVGKSLSLVDEYLREKRIATEIEVTEEAVITGYRNQYSQVLLNILQNARDAFEHGRPGDAKVKIRIGIEQGRSVVTITDNAGGIPEDIMDRIFDPYFTTKGPDKGTGVGLFMSRVIIEKNMGGRLTVRNTGDGAEFRIEV